MKAKDVKENAKDTTQRQQRRRLQSDFTPEIRTVNCGFYLTPEEAQRVKAEAKARNTSVSCLIREVLRNTNRL